MDSRPIVQRHQRGSILNVWVVPGSSRTVIVGRHGDSLKIRVAAPPEAGKANEAVEAQLTRVLGARATVERGHSSRRKRVVVEGLDPATVAEMLGM